jgi:hypothetical protein
VIERNPSRQFGQGHAIVFGLCTAAFLVAAVFLMFSTFMVYDDEGYVLLSLRNYAKHGGLYRDVYTQYGPFPFVAYSALQAIGVPLTHTVGRLITLGLWTGAAVSCAALAGYVMRSLVVRIAVLAAVFVFLWVMASEPTHPGGIIVFLTTLAAVLGHDSIINQRPKYGWVGVGAIIAALVLTKINVGAFAAFSAGAWVLLHNRNETIRRWAPLFLAFCVVLLPLGLMRPLLGAPWVNTYVLVFACAGISVVLATATGATGQVGWGTILCSMVGAVSLGLVVLGAIFLRGTSPREVLEGVLFAPMRQPTSFSLRYVWPAGIGGIAWASLALCGAASVLRRRHPVAVSYTVAFLQLSVAVALAVTIARFPSVRPDYLTFGFMLPCLWLFVWPMAGDSTRANNARSWVTWLLLGQSLHAFPVPGSQLAWGAVLAIPLAALGGWNAATWLALQKPGTWLTSRGSHLAAGAFLVGIFFTTAWQFTLVATRYRDGQFLSMPGAEMIRLPDNSAARYQVLTVNAVAYADILFSFPGMFSFNLWTDLPTPTHANVTHWFSLLDESQQRAIITALEAHPRACIIVDHAHLDFLKEKGLTPRGLLRDYIDKNFEPAFWVDRFAFCVHRGRQLAPFLLGDLLAETTSAGTDISSSTLLKFTLLIPPNRSVSDIEVTSNRSGRPSVLLNQSNARVEIAAATSRGEPLKPPAPATWPLRFSGPSIVHIYFSRENQPPITANTGIALRDSSGTDVALAWLRP